MSRPAAAGLPGLLAGLMIGIATADAGWWPPALLVSLGGLMVAMVVAGLRGSDRRWAGVLGVAVLVGVLAGGVRGSMAAPSDAAGSVGSLPTDTSLRLVAVVVDEPTPRGAGHDFVLEDVILRDPQVGDGPRTGRILVRVPRAFSAQAGDEVALEVSIRAPEPADPEEAAYRERLRRQGIGALGSAWELHVIGHRSGAILEAPAVIRRWLLDGLVRTVPEPEASLGAGILLGVRAGIDPAIRDAFAVAGLSHVVAISGWNVAIVVALIAAATHRLRERFGPRLPAVVAVLAVVAYVSLVGASPAVVRAALMAAALLIARLGGSPAHAASALMAAVVVMLLVTPSALWDVGFQLSALATGGLIVLAAPIESRLRRWPALIRTPFALTVAAQLATLPVLLSTFEQISLVAPLANVVVMPLIPAVMAGAAVAALVGALAGSVPLPLVADVGGWLAGGAAWLPLHGLIASGMAAAALPLAAVPLTGAPWFTAAWYPCLALVIRRLGRGSESSAEPDLEPMEPAPPGPAHVLPEAAAFAPVLAWVTGPRRVAVGVVLAVTLATATNGSDDRLHLTVLDIGQGDAILIEAPGGATALVDGGPDPDLTLRRLGQALPFHQRRIDIVVLTHPHQDHLGGLGEVLRRHDVELFIDPGRPVETGPYRALVEAAQRERGARIVTAEAGQRFRLGEATIEILFPDAADVAAPLPDDDINNGSIVLVVRYGAFEALLTGDAEAPVEALLTRRGRLGPVEVLKVAHHGSDSGTTAGFVSATRPAVAIISASADNSYGHPHRSTLDNLSQVPGIRLFRTDLDGSVEVVTDGTSFWVEAARGTVGPLPAR